MAMRNMEANENTVNDSRETHISHQSYMETGTWQHPSWRNWLARQTVNLEAVSSILTEGGAISRDSRD